jgi:hypothetical protein
MVDGFAKTFTSGENKVKKLPKRPKTAALPRELAFKKALLRKMGKEEEKIGINTVKE